MYLVRFFIFFFVGLFVALLLMGLVFLAVLTPKNIPFGTEVMVMRGDSLRDVSYTLKDAGVIRSALAFQVLVSLEKGESSVVAGTYLFGGSQSAHVIAERLNSGDFGTNSQSVTFPEGTTVQEMSAILSSRISNFDVASFIEHATPREGYLFPDTYFFHSDVTSKEVVQIMNDNFLEKTESVSPSSRVTIHTLEEIITMASILEEEAQTEDARRIVSGILWSRLEQDIPLQVDAAFLYIDELEGRDTYSLTVDDLKIDSPYNTYTNVGFPPTPITNPGLESITAAAAPIYSDYLFYLSDTQGNMYYAKTFEKHIENRQFLDY
ncbi:MAG: endolytic transglycosylase MltG [Candidatus Paceibacterota bacterium]